MVLAEIRRPAARPAGRAAAARPADAPPSGTPRGRRRIRAAKAPALVGLVATLYVGIGSWVPSVWYDEAATITSATRPLGRLWDELSRIDAVHGLYYAGMHVWFDLVGYTPFTLRAPSALAVGAASALLVVVLRSATTPRLAVLAGVILPLVPRAAWAGGEGRSYALGILAAVAVSSALWRALRTGRRRWWIAYGALATVGTLLFLYLALLLLAHAVTVAALAVGRLVERRDVLAWTAAVAASLLASSPLALLARSQDAQLDWLPGLGAQTPRYVLAGQWFAGSWPVAAGFGILVVAGLAVLIRRRSPLALWLLPVIVVPTSVLLAATALGSPLYSPRYLTFVTPAIAVAVAAAVAAIARRWARAVAIAAVVALSLPLVVTQLRAPDAKQDSTWSQVADLVAEQRSADPVPTAILWGPTRYHRSATSRVIAYAYPDAFAGTTDPTLVTSAAESGRLWERRGKLADSLGGLADARAAYLITSVKRDWIPSYTATLDGIGWTPVRRWNRGDVNVVKFVPTG